MPAGGGLMFGIDSYMIRMLTENPWEGGAGMSVREVALLSADQCYHRLCDSKILKSTGKRSQSLHSLAAANMADENGEVKGRTADGQKIKRKIRVGGKSLARRLMEEEEAKRKAAEEEARKTKKQTRRERRRRNK